MAHIARADAGLRELALFAGAGGGILGGQLLGWETIAAVEFDPYAASVLVARQNDGILPPFPIWDDVRTFDGRSWRGLVDVVSGGFPCQDISVAGKGAGIDGSRSGLWSEMARIIGEVRPLYAFVENSPALITRGLGRVLGDLAALGYDCRWTVLGASDVGAPHQRDRFWLVGADANLQRRREAWQLRPYSIMGPSRVCEALANANQQLGHKGRQSDAAKKQGGRRADRSGERSGEMADAAGQRLPKPWQRGHTSDSASHSGGQASDADNDSQWWSAEPSVGRVANGVAARVDRLKAIGNGQVPRVAESAWQMLMKRTSQGALGFIEGDEK